MNKWSLLLLPVLWLLQSTTSESIFVDGRHSSCDYSSRSVSDTRHSIYEPHCADHTFNKFRELTSPEREIRFSTNNVVLKQSSRLVERRLSYGDKYRVLNSDPSHLDRSTPSDSCHKEFQRDVDDPKIRNTRENSNDRTRSSHNDRIQSRLERNARERSINIEQEKIVILRSIRVHRSSPVRDGNDEGYYARESRTDAHRNINIDRKVNVNRRTYDDEESDEMLVRNRNMISRLETDRYTRMNKDSPHQRINQRENERFESRRSNENRQKGERSSDRRSQRDDGYIDKLQDIRQVRTSVFRTNSENGDDSTFVSIQRTERSLDQRRIRQVRKDVTRRLSEEPFIERLSARNNRDNIRTVEKRQFNIITSIDSNRRNEVIRRTLLEHRERGESRYSLFYRNRRVHDQTRIRDVIETRHLEDMLNEDRDTQRIILNNRQSYNDHVFDKVLEGRNNNRKILSRFDDKLLNSAHRGSNTFEKENRMSNGNGRAGDIRKNRFSEDRYTNRRIERQESDSNRIADERRDEFRHLLIRGTERAFDEKRIRQVRNIREYRFSEERNENSIPRERQVSIYNTDNRRNEAIRRTGILTAGRRENQFRSSLVHEREADFDRRSSEKMRNSREKRLEREGQGKSAQINDMDKSVIITNRYINEDAFAELARSSNRNTLTRTEREKLATVDKLLSSLKTTERENENRKQNDHRQTLNMLRREVRNNVRLVVTRRDFNTIAEGRRARTYAVFVRGNERALEENRSRQMRGIREYSLRDTGSYRVRNRSPLIEIRGDRIRSQVEGRQNKVTEHTIIVLNYKRDQPDLKTELDFEQSRNSLGGERRQVTRIEDQNNNRIAYRREVRSIIDRSNTRHIRTRVITRPTITQDLSYMSENLDQERRPGHIMRNIAVFRVDETTRRVRMNDRTRTNLRDLQELRSDKRRLDSEEHKSYRVYSGIVRQNDREVHRIRDAKVRASDVRFSYDSRSERDLRSLQRSKKTNENERETTDFTKMQFDALEEQTHTDNQIFEMNWQHVFYLLQGLYILGLFAKQTKDSDTIQKGTRFSNWFLQSSTLQ